VIVEPTLVAAQVLEFYRSVLVVYFVQLYEDRVELLDSTLVSRLYGELNFVLFSRHFRVLFFCVSQVLVKDVLDVVRVSFANKHCMDSAFLDQLHLLDLLFQRLALVFCEVSNTPHDIVFTSVESHLSSLRFFLHFFSVLHVFNFKMSLLELRNNFFFVRLVTFHPRMSKDF